jgi:hypothetical protein
MYPQNFTLLQNPSGLKSPTEIRQRIKQIRKQRQSALTTRKNFTSANDPALASYCLRLQIRIHELHWTLGEKPKYHA